MAIDLKFSKSDASSNWGFRVVGGADFQQPLIVVKVNENSLAQKAGLQTGDVIVKVNDKSTSTLTHSEVQQAISSAGLQFTLGIKRGEIIPPDLLQDEGKEIEVVMRDVQVTVDESIIEKAEELVDQLEKEIFVEFGKHKTTKSTAKGSAEKMVFSNSTQTYNTTEEKYKQKKWSTFLMKPERPAPKPKKLVEENKTDDGYKIVIKMHSRRKSLPKEKRVQFDQNILEIEHETDSPYSPEVPTSPDEDSLGSQPDPDSLEQNNEIDYHEWAEKYINSDSEQCSECEVPENIASDEESGFEHLRKDSLGESITYKPISEIIVNPYSDNAMTLEEQLRTVQKQLQALSQLPSSVQVTLDAVSKQIAEIFSTENENNGEQQVKDNEQNFYNYDKDLSASLEAAEAEGDDSNSVVGDELEEDSLIEKEIQDILEQDTLEEQENLEEINRIREEELEAKRREEELEAQRKEAELEALRKEEELVAKKEKVNQWNNSWPWSDTAKPFYRINFMKYTPPQKNLDHLQRSEVYRLIHSNETSTTTSRGIVARPEKILPEQDYYEATRANQ